MFHSDIAINANNGDWIQTKTITFYFQKTLKATIAAWKNTRNTSIHINVDTTLAVQNALKFS